MRKNVKKKDEENCRTGKAIAGSEMKEKREEEWKAAQRREMSRNIEEIITMVLLGYEGEEKNKEEKEMKKEEKKREKGVEIQEKE